MMKRLTGIDELEQRKRDYVSVFTSSAGKRVLKELEMKCFVNRSTYAEGNRIFLNEGMRAVVVHIKNMLNMPIGELRKLERKGE